MIWKLMWRELRKPTAWFIAAVAAGLVIRWPVAGFTMLLPMYSILYRLGSTRAGVYEAALPMLPRDLIAARMLTRLAIAWIPMSAWVIASLMQHVTRWTLAQLLLASGLATLAILLPFCIKPGSLRVSRVHALVLPALAFLVFAAACTFVLRSSVALVLISAAIAGLFLFTLATVPSTFQVAETKVSPNRPSISPSPSRQWSQSLVRREWMPVLRSLVVPQSFVFFPLMAFFAATGNFGTYILIFGSLGHTLLKTRLSWMAALPFSHRQRLLILIFPQLCIIGGAVVIGRMLPFAKRYDNEITYGAPYSRIANRSFENRTRVSLAFWSRLDAPLRPTRQIVVQGKTAIITAPWGETVNADTLSVLGATYFNPYTTNEQSSRRFVTWQFYRASLAVYGRPIYLEQYDANPSMRPEWVTSSLRVQILAAAFCLTLLLYVFWGTEMPLWYRLRSLANRYVTVGLPFVLWSPVFVTMFVGWRYTDRGANGLVTALWQRWLLSLSAALPANIMFVVVVAAIPVAFMYAALEWMFVRSEQPITRAKIAD